MPLTDILDFIDFALNRELFEIGALRISILWILQLVVAFFLLSFIAGKIKLFLRNRLLLRLGIDEGNREIVASLVSYVFSLLGAIFIFQSLGISLGSIGLIAGGLGIGAGFGLQDITKNVISGLTILAEGNLKAGNFIEFNGLLGYIRDISLRSTIVRTLDGGDIIIPNSALVDSQVLNWSYDTLMGRIHVPVGVAYGSDPILVTEIILNSAYMEPEVLKEPPPRVIFQGFGENSLDFELLVWIPDIEKFLFLKSSLRYIIEYNLRQYGIEIPFPQRDIWIRNPEVLYSSSQSNRSSEEQPQTASQDMASQSPRTPLLRDLLRQVDCFRSCDDLDILKLIEVSHRQLLDPEQILVRQGDQNCTFYLILSGSLQSLKADHPEPMETFQVGDFFGEIPMMLGLPSPVTIQALTSTNLFAINKTGFQILLKQRPDLAEKIAQELAKEAQAMEECQRILQELSTTDRPEASQAPIRWIRQQLQRFLT